MADAADHRDVRQNILDALNVAHRVVEQSRALQVRTQQVVATARHLVQQAQVDQPKRLKALGGPSSK